MLINFKTPFKSFFSNIDGNDYVVGDIHGHLPLLIDTLSKANFDFKQDRLFSVGDIIDRGPFSYECLQLIKEPWFFPVIGNHEIAFIKTVLYKENDIRWIKGGGGWYLDYDINALKDFAHYLIQNIPLALEIRSQTKKIGVVHAEPLPDWELVKSYTHQFQKFLTENREKNDTNDLTIIDNINTVYCGHCINKKPKQLGNVIYIDTSAYKNKKLTLIKL